MKINFLFCFVKSTPGYDDVGGEQEDQAEGEPKEGDGEDDDHGGDVRHRLAEVDADGAQAAVHLHEVRKSEEEIRRKVVQICAFIQQFK